MALKVSPREVASPDAGKALLREKSRAKESKTPLNGCDLAEVIGLGHSLKGSCNSNRFSAAEGQPPWTSKVLELRDSERPWTWGVLIRAMVRNPGMGIL